MKVKEIMKKSMWIMLVILLSFLMFWIGRDTSENIWLEGKPTFHYYAALFWEILKSIAVIVPVWLLSLLGLMRSFLGENWFPIAEKIPARMTKILLAVSTILLIGITVMSWIYAEYSKASYRVRYTMENIFSEVQIVSAWILLYSILLFVEQWSLKRNCTRQDIRKKQRWVTISILLTWLILVELGGVALWYIPLERVGDLNSLEDYYLWWFSLFCAVFNLPFLFFAIRKVIRLFMNNEQWLALSDTIPRKITAGIAFAATGFMVMQIRESHYWNNWVETADLPEYGEAAAMGHTFLALMWGMVLVYALCLLIKQFRAVRKPK